MGHPRKFKNKYVSPKKLWDKDRIKEDKTLRSEYGLKNNKELWIAAAELKKYRREARRLLSMVEEERKGDTQKILLKLNRFGILDKSAELDDVLSLNVKTVLERRLQTRVWRKGLAKTPKQARQLIAHGFIAIGEDVVSIPGFLVTEEQDSRLKLSRPIDLELKEAVEESKETPKEDKTEPKKEVTAGKTEEKPEAKEASTEKKE